MYTPTYQKLTADNAVLKSAKPFPLDNESPNSQVAIQLVVTPGTGTVEYTVYQTAFQATGPISGQTYQFDILDLKYWDVLGTASALVNQYLTVTMPASAVWVVATVTGDATLEYSVLQRGLQ